MALGTTRTIVEDLGSDEVRFVRLAMNNIADALESLADELEGAASFAAAQTAITNTVQPLVAEIRKVVASLERPLPPEAPAVPGP